jgi:ATP-binding cassette subfamily F protein uup
MAHLLGADSVSLTLGTRTLLDGVSLGVDDGDRIGVVGPNGAGKSTLLRVLAGRATPDAGRVTSAGSFDVALLDQRDELPAGTTVRELVHGTAPEHTWASDPRSRSVHEGLLGDLDLEADVATLSGGPRRPRCSSATTTSSRSTSRPTTWTSRASPGSRRTWPSGSVAVRTSVAPWSW